MCAETLQLGACSFGAVSSDAHPGPVAKRGARGARRKAFRREGGIASKLLNQITRLGPRFSVFAGLAIGFEIDCRVEVESGGIDVEADYDEFGDVLGRKETDFGVAFRAGLSFPLGTSAIVADGRYTLGLTNIVDTDGADASVKNRAFSFMAGFSIPLGGMR